MTIKLLDHLADERALETSTNPFAAVVLAHGQALTTQNDAATRRDLKLRLVKGLYERGLDADDIRELFRIFDWIMTLPDYLQDAFRDDVFRFEEENAMPYITSIERRAMEKGLREGMCKGIALSLEIKFAPSGRKLMRQVRAIEDVAKLEALSRALKKARTLHDVHALLAKGSQAKDAE